MKSNLRQLFWHIFIVGMLIFPCMEIRTYLRKYVNKCILNILKAKLVNPVPCFALQYLHDVRAVFLLVLCSDHTQHSGGRYFQKYL